MIDLADQTLIAIAALAPPAGYGIARVIEDYRGRRTTCPRATRTAPGKPWPPEDLARLRHPSNRGPQ